MKSALDMLYSWFAFITNRLRTWHGRLKRNGDDIGRARLVNPPFPKSRPFSIEKPSSYSMLIYILVKVVFDHAYTRDVPTHICERS